MVSATTKLIGAALPTFCFYGAAGAQVIDPGANRLPLFPNDVCGAGSEGLGAAAYFAVGSPSELAGVSGRLLRHVLDSVLRDGGWVLLTGHVDAAEAGEAGQLDGRLASRRCAPRTTPTATKPCAYCDDGHLSVNSAVTAEREPPCSSPPISTPAPAALGRSTSRAGAATTGSR